MIPSTPRTFPTIPAHRLPQPQKVLPCVTAPPSRARGCATKWMRWSNRKRLKSMSSEPSRAHPSTPSPSTAVHRDFIPAHYTPRFCLSTAQLRIRCSQPATRFIRRHAGRRDVHQGHRSVRSPRHPSDVRPLTVDSGAALIIGGPALVWYVSPTEEEIFKKYNPDLQKRALAQRESRQQDFDDFVTHLKEAAKSDKPIWIAQKEMDQKRALEKNQRLRDDQANFIAEAERRRAEIRSSSQ
ncbi:hypothetical protein PMIN06_000473 [Paraphaeosphaeria minitans]